MIPLFAGKDIFIKIVVARSMDRSEFSDAVSIAAVNGPRQVVISGDAPAVTRVVAEAARYGWGGDKHASPVAPVG